MSDSATKSIPNNAPMDAESRGAASPLICYELDKLPPVDLAGCQRASQTMTQISVATVPPRDAITFEVEAGHFFRIVSEGGPRVGDWNLWNAADLSERFFSGKTRQLHATHVTTGDRLWSNLPGLRPMATITRDTLDWYGWDDDGAGYSKLNARNWLAAGGESLIRGPKAMQGRHRIGIKAEFPSKTGTLFSILDNYY